MTIRTCITLYKSFTPKLRNVYASVTILKRKNSTIPQQSIKSEEPKEVYYGVLTPQIKAVKFFSLSSSMVGIMAQPLLYNAVMKSGSVPVIVTVYSLIGFFTFVTPFLLHIITKKYVTHLFYKPISDTYIARTVNFFCVTRELEFKVDDVKVPDISGMFTTFVANDKALFLDPKLFPNPQHYIRIMGYDKPIDLKLHQSNNDNNNNDGTK